MTGSQGHQPQGLPSLVVTLLAALGAARAAPLWAQPAGSHPASSSAQPAANASAPAGTARDTAPFDLSGYWVSLVTADWRFRMVVPGKGEYAGIPINDAGKAFADKWSRSADDAAGKQCEAYGAAAVMAVPERLHIRWRSADTLEVQTDAGMQSRLLHFSQSTARQSPSLQGYSTAHWLMAPNAPPVEEQPFAIATASAPRPSGQLEVDTGQMLPGLLRKNGVPYSGQATMVEYWELHTDMESHMRIIAITSRVTDPQYLAEPYVFNTLFAAQSDAAGWDPEPCSLEW